MKYDVQTRTLELTERNVRALLDKLADPLSVRILAKDGMFVQAVFGKQGFDPERPMLFLNRENLESLLAGRGLDVGGNLVMMVSDETHYFDRAPGVVFMPSEGRYY